MGIEEDIASFEKRGYKYRAAQHSYVETPSGLIHLAEYLYDSCCPLCESYLNDNPEEEVVSCFHSKETIREIEGSKIFYKLIIAKEWQDACLELGF